MTLSHLGIAIGAATPALLLYLEALRRTTGLPAPARVLLAAAGLPVAGLLVLILGWQLYRIFRHPPLFLSATPCPHCGARPGYEAVRSEWPRILLSCPSCGGEFELWMSRRVPPDRLTPGRPAFRLGWPELVRRWRRLA